MVSMKKILIVFFIVLMLVPAGAGCALRKDGKYTCREFSVEFPLDWNKRLDWGIFGDLISVVDPSKTASINFTTIEVKANTTIEDVMQETLKQLHLNVVESGYTIIDGRRALWFKAIGTEQIILEYLISNGDRIYTIMGAALPKSFDRSKKIIQDAANSFKFNTSKI